MKRLLIALLLLAFSPAWGQFDQDLRNLTMSGWIDHGTIGTFTDTDATPDVSTSEVWDTFTNALTITDFDHGGAAIPDARRICARSQGAITYDCTGAGFDCGTTDIVTAAGDITCWEYDGTDWDLHHFTDQSDDLGLDAGVGGDIGDVFSCASGDCDDVTVEDGDELKVDPGGEVHATETVIGVNNDSGSILYACTAVYISAFDVPSDLPEVEIADADDAAKMPAVGLVETDIANGADGIVVISGNEGDWDTAGFTVGDEVYVNDSGTSADNTCSNTLTATRPANTDDNVQKMGIVTRVHATAGQINVSGAGRSNDVPNLQDAYLWVGNGSNVATAVQMSSDATMSNAGAVTVVDDSHAHVIANVDSMTSAALAGQISNESGTGLIAMTTDGVFTTPALGTPSALVLTNATGLPSSGITTVVVSDRWNAGAISADGTQCADAAEVTINSGPIRYTIICADNDASIFYFDTAGSNDGYDGGTFTIELGVLSDNATPADEFHIDFSAQCRGNSDVINSTWGSEVAADVDFDAAGTCGGSACVQYELAAVTTAAITGDGTCAAGDIIFVRGSLDATGTTATVADVHILYVKMERTDGFGD